MKPTVAEGKPAGRYRIGLNAADCCRPELPGSWSRRLRLFSHFRTSRSALQEKDIEVYWA